MTNPLQQLQPPRLGFLFSAYPALPRGDAQSTLMYITYTTTMETPTQTQQEGAPIESKNEQKSHKLDFNQIQSYKSQQTFLDGIPVSDPSWSYADQKLRKAGVEMFTAAGAIKVAESQQGVFNRDWKLNVNDEKLVNAVGVETKAQKDIMNAETPEKLASAIENSSRALVVVNNSIHQGPSVQDMQQMKGLSQEVETAEVKREYSRNALQLRETDESNDPSKNVERTTSRMERAQEALRARKEKAKAGLEKMGLGTKVAKGLEAWGKANPKLRLALGLTLAAASVATGTVAFSMIGKALSATTFAANRLSNRMRNAKEQGKELNMAKEAVISILVGLGAAAGASFAFQELGSLFEFAKENAGHAYDGAKEYMFGQTDSVAGATEPVASINTPEEIGATEPAVPSVEQAVLPDYTVQPGDNLTKVIMEKVMPSIDGADNLTSFQKENMIQNMLKYAAANPADPDFAFINGQFIADPNLIHPGDSIDLDKLKMVLNDSRFGKFGGDTLLEHAVKL